MKTTIIEKIELKRVWNDDANGDWSELRDTGIRYDVDGKVSDEYAERMTEGDKFPPIVVFREGDKLYVADGFHRIAAAGKNDFKDIEAEIHEGTRLDALWYALGANRQHGQRLSAKDREHAVKMAIKEFPDKSLRDVADRIGCSHEYVRKIKDMVSEVSTVDTCAKVTGKDGKSYPAKQPKANTTERVEKKTPAYIAPELQGDDDATQPPPAEVTNSGPVSISTNDEATVKAKYQYRYAVNMTVELRSITQVKHLMRHSYIFGKSQVTNVFDRKTGKPWDSEAEKKART